MTTESKTPATEEPTADVKEKKVAPKKDHDVILELLGLHKDKTIKTVLKNWKGYEVEILADMLSASMRREAAEIENGQTLFPNGSIEEMKPVKGQAREKLVVTLLAALRVKARDATALTQTKLTRVLGINRMTTIDWIQDHERALEKYNDSISK